MSRATQDTAGAINRFVYGTVTSFGQSFQYCSTSDFQTRWQSYYPNDAGTSLVWAIPRSIATTKGITLVFSSSGY